jgi:hypothetical protein
MRRREFIAGFGAATWPVVADPVGNGRRTDPVGGPQQTRHEQASGKVHRG